MADIKSRKTRLARLTLLQEFDAAPLDALFTQTTVAALLHCSIANIERGRWQGTGIPFRRIGGSIRYSKRDILAWLSQYQPVHSTAEADAQATRLRREALSDAPSSAASGERHKPVRTTAETRTQAKRRREALSDADRIATSGED